LSRCDLNIWIVRSGYRIINRYRKAGGFGSHGEPARLLRGRGGKVTGVHLAGARLVDSATDDCIMVQRTNLYKQQLT
jgi:hypothetical protein